MGGEFSGPEKSGTDHDFLRQEKIQGAAGA
jgi:hypothetical protein